MAHSKNSSLAIDFEHSEKLQKIVLSYNANHKTTPTNGKNLVALVIDYMSINGCDFLFENTFNDNEEWKLFSEFRKWFDNHYIEGWSLDKDILVKGNKVYGPKTCCFVPNEINTFFTKRQNDRGKFVIGVVNKRNNKYISSISINGHIKHLGCFETEEEAFDAYKEAKEGQAKKLADKYKTQLDPRVYEALYNYNVAITD